MPDVIGHLLLRAVARADPRPGTVAAPPARDPTRENGSRDGDRHFADARKFPSLTMAAADHAVSGLPATSGVVSPSL